MTSRDARFACGRDLRELRTPPYGIFLGYHGFPARPLLSDKPGHALVVAPTRMGKGVGVLMQNALAWPSSLIVLDPKGEFRQRTLHWRAQYQECFTWGPTTFAARWNPLAEIAALDPDDQMEEAITLARAFSSAAGTSTTSNDSFWTSEGTSFLAHAFLWAATCQPEVCATLAHVYDLLCSPADLTRLLQSLQHADHRTLSSWASGYQSQSETVAASILATARSYLRSFASTAVRDSTAAADLTYARLLAPGTTLYLTATAKDFKNHGALLVAFLEGFTSRALSHTGTLVEPCLLLLDEFSLLPPLPSLETLLTLSAGYNLRLLVVLQNLEQVKPDTRSVLLSNCHDQIFFAARDPLTCDHLSKRLGTVYRKSKSRTRSRGGTSHSTSERREELLAGHQIRAMKQALLFHGNAPAARIKLRPYFRDKRFMPRVGEVIPPTPTPYAAPALDDLLPHDRDARQSPRTPDPSKDESATDLDTDLDALDALFDEEDGP